MDTPVVEPLSQRAQKKLNNAITAFGIENFERPRVSCKVICNLLPCKAKITLQGQNPLRNASFVHVFKGIFGGWSPKIT